jgi:leader peptidase (prepilin peptidase)/N-methyltransferase
MSHVPPTGDAPMLMRRFSYANLTIGLIGLAAAAASVFAVPGAGGILGAGLALLMLAIAVVDFRHLIIPNELNAAAAVFAAINAAIGGPTSVIEGVTTAVLRGAITMLFFLVIRSIYGKLRHREGIGLGDVKLAFVAGAWLGWVMIPVAIEIAAVTVLITYLVVWQAIARQPVSLTSRLPFGLFLAPAIWIAWLLGEVIFSPY